MKSLKFKGLMAPVFTAFTEKNVLNLDIVPKYAKYLADNGVRGVLVNGTTGEGISMTSAERMLHVEAWMSQSKQHGFTTMVQIGGTNFVDLTQLAKHAEGLEVDSLLCLPELYFYPQNVNDLVNYLFDVSEAAPNTPLFYYHIPMFTRLNFDMEEFCTKALAKIPTFGGIKFTHTNLEELQRAIQVNQNLVCFLGSDQLTFGGYIYGCSSQIATLISIIPQTMQQILDFAEEKKYAEAYSAQSKVIDAVKAISKHGSWISTMKFAMKVTTGLDFGLPRKPLRSLSDESETNIRQFIQANIL